MSILKQSTAATIKLGPFVDDGDGKSAEDALTISQADIRLSKNGGDIAQSHNAAGATHDELGYYDVPLDTTDTDTLGRLRVLVSETGALPVWQDFIVVTANVYDSLFSTDKLDVNVAEMASGIITATVIATDAIDAGAIKADAVTKIQNGLATPTNITAGTITTVTNAPTDMAKESTLTAIKGASWTDENLTTIDANVDAILADTGTDGVVLKAAGLAADAVTEIQSGLATAAALDAVDNFLDTEIAAILADTNELQTDWVNDGRLDLLLDAASVGGDPWSTALPGAYGAGTAGKALSDALADTNELQTDWANGGRLDLILDNAAAAYGSGSVTVTYTVKGPTGTGVPNAYVRVTTDLAGTVFVVDGYTNTSGQVIFYLDPGTYYFWPAHPEYAFTVPDVEVVT